MTEDPYEVQPVLTELAGYGAALVSDAMGRRGSLASDIQPRWAGARVAGRAFTCWTREGDNQGIHAALDHTQPGDVLVVDGHGATVRALIGEMIGIKAKARGLHGFVLDGASRDTEALADLAMPVFARGQVPAGPFKTGPYELGGVISCGGVVIAPGDLVIGDADGVSVVPLARGQEVLEAARAIAEGEVRKREINAEPRVNPELHA